MTFDIQQFIIFFMLWGVVCFIAGVYSHRFYIKGKVSREFITIEKFFTILISAMYLGLTVISMFYNIEVDWWFKLIGGGATMMLIGLNFDKMGISIDKFIKK